MRAASLVSWTIAIILVFSLVFSTAAYADEKESTSLEPHSIGTWIGISYDSPTGLLLGTTPGRNFHEVVLRLDWRIVEVQYFRADYTLDIIPFAMLTGNPNRSLSFFRSQPVSGSATLYGIGAAPLGLRLGIPLSKKRVFLFASGSMGFLIFESPAPTIEASAFNYTFDLGGGVEIAVSPGFSLVGGYKLHHFSNADRALENPGVDSNMYYLGVNWIR